MTRHERVYYSAVWLGVASYAMEGSLLSDEVASARKSYAKFYLVQVYVYVCINLSMYIALEGERGKETERGRERREREGGRGRERELPVAE